MVRGTTPTLQFELPFDATDIDDGYITIAQRGKSNLDIPLSRCTVKENTIEVTLTQEETLAFCPIVAEIQMRIKIDDKVLASQIIEVNIGTVLKDGVI